MISRKLVHAASVALTVLASERGASASGACDLGPATAGIAHDLGPATPGFAYDLGRAPAGVAYGLGHASAGSGDLAALMAPLAGALAADTAGLKNPVYRLGTAIVRGNVPEIVMPGLPDAAMAEMTSGGPVILYNPVLYRNTGAAREFVRAHEYGHVLLHHLENDYMASTDQGRAEAEAQADCFAARNASRRSILAMVEILCRRLPEEHDAIYGTTTERAGRILTCAGMPSS